MIALTITCAITYAQELPETSSIPLIRASSARLTLCGNDSFFARVTEEAFVAAFLVMIEGIGIGTTMAFISDTGGGGLRFVGEPFVMDQYGPQNTAKKRKRHVVRAWMKQQRMRES